MWVPAAAPREEIARVRCVATLEATVAELQAKLAQKKTEKEAERRKQEIIVSKFADAAHTVRSGAAEISC